MKALHTRLSGVALVLVQEHMSYAASLELRMHPDLVDGGCVIGNTKLTQINFTHHEPYNPAAVFCHTSREASALYSREEFGAGRIK